MVLIKTICLFTKTRRSLNDESSKNLFYNFVNKNIALPT